MKHRRLLISAAAALLLVAAAAVIAILFLNLGAPATEVRLSPPRSETGGSGGVEGEGESGPVYAVLRPDTVQFALSAIEKPASYTCRYTVENFWEGGEAITDVTVHLREGLMRVCRRTGDEEKNVLLTPEDYYVWNSGSEEVWHGSRGSLLAGPELDQAVRMSGSYEDLLSLDPSAILETGYEPLDGRPCIWVKAETGSLGYISEYYIAPDTGLLLKNEVRDGDRLVYRLLSEEIVLSAPDESEFALPGE